MTGLKSLVAMSTCYQCSCSCIDEIAAFIDKHDIAMEFLTSHGVITVNVKYPKCHKNVVTVT